MQGTMQSLKTLAALIVALAVVTGSALAQTKPAPAPLTSSKAQVNAVVDKVVDGLWEETDHFWHDGDYQRIVDLCRVIVEADPSFNEAYSNAAWLLWSLGDIPGADAFLEFGINRTPSKGELYYEFGRHLYTTKRYPSAKPYLEKAVAYPNAQPTWYSTLGHTYRQLKDYDNAVKTWAAVVEKFPTFVSGPPNLKRVQALKNGQPQ
jgi:tetratricopeptide (TPR) repeat protein